MPLMDLLVIGIVGGLGYAWLMRGFLSALLNLLCVLVSGAIAFAVWETVAHLILDNAPRSGFMYDFGSSAWAIGLALPFAASLAISRLAVDSVVRANTKLSKGADYAGGAVCGVASGIIVAGMAVLSLGFLRGGSEFLSFKPVDFDSNGSVKRVGGLWVPVDRWTAALYGKLSEQTFRSGDALARWYPDLSDVPSALRLTYQDAGRNTLRTQDIELVGRYTVGEEAKGDVKQLLSDRWDSVAQNVTDFEGNPLPAGSRIEAFQLVFKPGAVEKEGRVVIGNAQVNMVAESADGERRTFFPFAVVSRSETGTDKRGRWRFDGRGVFIASLGGEQDPRFDFEFLTPRGFTPIALYVKNVRFNLEEGPAAAKKPIKFASVAARDATIDSSPVLNAGSSSLGGTPASAGGQSDGDTSEAIRLGDGKKWTDATQPPPGFEVTNGLGFIIQLGTHGALEVDEDNRILGGEAKFNVEEIRNNRVVDRKLQIARFLPGDDTVLIKVDVSRDMPHGLLSPVAKRQDLSEGPSLIDSLGERYLPVGFIYNDQNLYAVRFTPGQPIQSLNELDAAKVMISSSRPDQKLSLVFRVGLEREVTEFRIGKKVIALVQPGIPLKNRQR